MDKQPKPADQAGFDQDRSVSLSADIEKLMALYHLGKGPLSVVLGFGEVTIARYLAGQAPSPSYEKIIQKALASPEFMKEKLQENGAKISQAAYRKAMKACEDLQGIVTISPPLMQAIAILFDQLYEVTPLSLQKLLYFAQAIHLARNGKPLFEEDMQAWVHGPVIAQVYELFKDFKYNPIEDDRFVLIESAEGILDEEARKNLELVASSFGRYSGKVLEQITHREQPWKEARKGLSSQEPSERIMPKEKMEAYFREMIYRYGLRDPKEVQEYIDSILKEES